MSVILADSIALFPFHRAVRRREMEIRPKLILLILSLPFTAHQAQRDNRCDDVNISAKARRHFCSERSSVSVSSSPVKVEEESTFTKIPIEVSPYYDFEETSKLERPEGPLEYQVTSDSDSNKETFFSEDDEVSFCDQLMEGFDDMTGCVNRSEPVLVTRWRDVVLEKLISQSWRDTRDNINNNAEYAGVKLNPLMVDALVGSEPAVSVSQDTALYSANMNMWNVSVHGLSSIYINQIRASRAQNLYDLDIKVVFKVDKLSVRGMYNLEGSLGGWWGAAVNSNGDWPFAVDILNATLSPHISLDTSDTANNDCGNIGDVVVSELGIPFNYDDISINFENLGSGYNTLINGVSIFFLKTQEEKFVSVFKNTIKEKVHSIIC